MKVNGTINRDIMYWLEVEILCYNKDKRTQTWLHSLNQKSVLNLTRAKCCVTYSHGAGSAVLKMGRLMLLPADNWTGNSQPVMLKTKTLE